MSFGAIHKACIFNPIGIKILYVSHITFLSDITAYTLTFSFNIVKDKSP